jgi:tRNA(Ile)-lysidine synthase
MAAWCRAHDAEMLLTAHTLDDQAETVLMRLGRTLSPESLAGVAVLGSWEGVPLFRPLLRARRLALRAYLSGLGQAWLEDPSNEDRRFERVRVRQSLAGLGVAGVTPERLAALADAGARTADLLEKASTRWLSLWLREEDAGLCHVPVAPFVCLPQALQEKLLARIIGHYGGGQFRPEPRELRRLAQWVEQGAGPPRCTLGGALIGRRASSFWVTREATRIPPVSVRLPAGGETLWDNRFRVKAAPGSAITPAGDRRIEGDEDVPAFARRARPWVEQPPGVSHPVEILFQRLVQA